MQVYTLIMQEKNLSMLTKANYDIQKYSCNKKSAEKLHRSTGDMLQKIQRNLRQNAAPCCKREEII